MYVTVYDGIVMILMMMMMTKIIITYCNNNLNGKYRAIVGPKFPDLPGDSECRGSAVVAVLQVELVVTDGNKASTITQYHIKNELQSELCKRI